MVTVAHFTGFVLHKIFARGLFSQSAANTPGFVQPIVKTDGSVGTISPFLMPQSITDVNGHTVQLYPEDTDSVNHGHTASDAKLDLVSNVAQNDRYAFTEEGLSGTLTCSGGSCSYAQRPRHFRCPVGRDAVG